MPKGVIQQHCQGKNILQTGESLPKFHSLAIPNPNNPFPTQSRPSRPKGATQRNCQWENRPRSGESLIRTHLISLPPSETPSPTNLNPQGPKESSSDIPKGNFPPNRGIPAQIPLSIPTKTDNPFTTQSDPSKPKGATQQHCQWEKCPHPEESLLKTYLLTLPLSETPAPPTLDHSILKKSSGINAHNKKKPPNRGISAQF